MKTLTTPLLYILLLLALAARLLIHPATIQQDPYADYAKALKNGTVNTGGLLPADTRLMPGYPAIITITSVITRSEISAGLAVSLISALLAIVVFYLLTKNLVATTVFAFFPPVWLAQSSKITTEPLNVLLLLLGLLFFTKHRYLVSGLIMGMAFDVRFISVCLFLAAALFLWHKKDNRAVVRLAAGMLLPILGLAVFNIRVFGPTDIFHQLLTYPKVGGAGGTAIGIITILQDLPRSLDWHQYRIFASGSFYLILNFAALWFLGKKRNLSQLFNISFWWTAFSLIFIFSLGPVPLLEEFARFTVPFCPAVILGLLPKGIIPASKEKLQV